MNLDWSRMGEMEYIDRMGRDGLVLFRRNKKVVIVGSFVFVFIFVFVFVSVFILIGWDRCYWRKVDIVGSARQCSCLQGPRPPSHQHQDFNNTKIHGAIPRV